MLKWTFYSGFLFIVSILTSFIFLRNNVLLDFQFFLWSLWHFSYVSILIFPFLFYFKTDVCFPSSVFTEF